jgi:UDP-N-acetylmuramoyl-L-alanyl-D-glutamate--2,6-diaminopimelate ligase
MMSLKSFVADALPDWKGVAALPEISIEGIECDSRGVKKGFLFFAIPGVKLDGSAFVTEALSKGAAAVVAARPVECPAGIPSLIVPEPRAALARIAASFYGRPSERMRAVGITGTNGKTTISYLLEHIFSRQGQSTGVFGTVSTRFAGREIPAGETTPGPLKIQPLLAEMAAAGVKFAVMEVSSHALDQHRVDGIRFETAIFTNLTRDHLDYHKTFENYFEAKSKLFTGLAPSQVAVINIDDEWGRKLVPMTRAKVFAYGIDSRCDFRAENIEWHVDSTRFILTHGKEKLAVESPLVGRHNVYNVLAALAAASALGLDLKKASAGLKGFAGVPGRLERVPCEQGFLVFVDYAHTPDGLENVLGALKPYAKKKLISVFGCGGERDKAKRPQMGRIAAQYSDKVIITSDNPRSEDPKVIAAEIRAGVPEDFKGCEIMIDRHKAIRHALMQAKPGDIVLLAGKGHETTQVTREGVFQFSDRLEAEKVLSGR